MPPPKDILEQLLDKMVIGDDCWIWIGAKTRGGYGHLKVKGKSQRAARVVYELLVGPIAAGLELDHTCRVPACVRPTHLEPVTPAENQRRMRAALGIAARHGTRSMYGGPQRCRCHACVRANRGAQRLRYAERQRPA